MGKFLIGLIIGVSIAGGVVYYLNNTPVKFENKLANTSESMTNGDEQPTMLSPGTKIQETNGQPNSGKHDASAVDYDFYQILQDKNNNSNQESTQVLRESITKNTSVYYIQAGAFNDISAANNMQAQLALQGYEAKVKSTKIHSGMINKVLMGPYTSDVDANKIRQELKNNGISTTILKLN